MDLEFLPTRSSSWGLYKHFISFPDVKRRRRNDTIPLHCYHEKLNCNIVLKYNDVFEGPEVKIPIHMYLGEGIYE